MASLPVEFFTPDELAEILGTPQPKRQRELLSKQGVPFAVSASGHPRVYRDKLLPSSDVVTIDQTIDFSALAGRKTQKARQH